jgi:prepilin-type N-terminal cleavage/methylation domain-containing protein
VNRQGFSLVEIMVAMAILSMTVVSIITLQNASLRSSTYARQLTVASLLARSVMVDAYLYNHARLLSKAIKEEKSEEASMAGMDFKWTWMLDEVPLELPDLSPQEEQDGDQPQQANPLMKPIVETVNTFLKEAMRELSVEVSWETPKGKESVYFVTHLIDFSHPMQIPPSALSAFMSGAASSGSVP